MSVIIKADTYSGSTPFESAPAGQYVGIIYKSIDQGTHETKFKNQDGSTKYNRQSMLTVELHNLADPTILTKDKKPFVGTLYVTHSLNVKAVLTRVSIAAFGIVKYNELVKSQGGVGLEDLLEKAFVCNVIEKESGGTKIDNTTLAELQPGVVVPKRINDTVFFSLNEVEFSPEVYDSLSDKQKEKISSSPEYKTCAGKPQVGIF